MRDRRTALYKQNSQHSYGQESNASYKDKKQEDQDLLKRYATQVVEPGARKNQSDLKAKDYNFIKGKNPFDSVEEEQIENLQQINSKEEALNNFKNSQSA